MKKREKEHMVSPTNKKEKKNKEEKKKERNSEVDVQRWKNA